MYKSFGFVEFVFEIRFFLPYEITIYEAENPHVPVKVVRFLTEKKAVAYARQMTSEWAMEDETEFDWLLKRYGKIIDGATATISLVRVPVQVTLRSC